MRTRGYEWLIEADPVTNESLAAYLASEGIAAESAGQARINGKLRHVWSVPYQVITQLTKASKIFPFKFRIFVKEGGGEPREYKLHQKRRVSVHSKKALVRLKEIGARK